MITQRQCSECGEYFEPDYKDQTICRFKHGDSDDSLSGAPKPRLFRFRCTRNEPYFGVKVAGAHNTSARQGYYIDATDQDAALQKMRVRFPMDVRGFTAELWRD